MAGNQVVLTFAGETKNIEGAFDRVGGSSKKMTAEVEKSGKGFEKAGEAADTVDTKAMGFRDTITGVQDTMSGFKALTLSSADASKTAARAQAGYDFAVKKYGQSSLQAQDASVKLSNAQNQLQQSQQSLGDKLFLLGSGVGDLGSGFFNFLIPALEKTKLATLASAAASKIAALGTKIWAGAQWVMNAALDANPIGLVVLAIAALVAIIIVIATKTTWFQKAWKAAWGWIKSAAVNTWDWLKQLPGWIGAAFSKIAGAITWPFRAAFNFISDAWNHTIGSLSWSVPSWVPIIGGNTISVPHLPKFHTGGVVPGRPGQEVPIMAMAGETVTPAGRGAATVIRIESGGTQLDDLLVEILSRAVRVRGGNVQLALGGANG